MAASPYQPAFLGSLRQLKQASLILCVSGEDTTRVSMKTICSVFAVMHSNNEEQTLPRRPGHLSKCVAVENSGFTERIVAVGEKYGKLKNVCFSGILKNILVVASKG